MKDTQGAVLAYNHENGHKVEIQREGRRVSVYRPYRTISRDYTTGAGASKAADRLMKKCSVLGYSEVVAAVEKWYYKFV